MVYTIIQHLTAKDSPDAIDKLKSKLVEASAVFGKDRETLAWIPMQDAVDRRRFTVVERYRDESSHRYHVENPYWKTFDPEVNQLLEKPVELRRCNELDTSGNGAGAHYHEDARGDTSVTTMYADSV
ncbi:hypothetical protein BU26DRAFT_602157 [Trematosphaeria pertusa]|uniref:ABM domain-containing protein n=1 Tax=Trematosphaeria pertusa TaxID=390896 RepID=A0A6A6IM11_9PLEO|nr:uncharacterized protein BU26DRAFT_602157 [Trematosphaeria pertusa]KAF2251614.1 hypothetical protein BU26DRAFT_602157 [Trematosphaeria pertusa]